MSTIDLQIADSSDDCLRTTDEVGQESISLSNASVYFYYHNFLGTKSSGVRFKKVGIPQGSTITAAYITLTSNGNYSGTTASSILSGEAANFATTFTTYENYDARVATTATVAWNSMVAWTTDTEYNSPSIVTIVQEIVDNASWQPGGAITFFWRNNGSSNGINRIAYSFDGSASKAPKLHIEYTASTTAIIKQIAASTDDCYVYYNSGGNGTISLTTANFFAGRGSSVDVDKLGGGMRFLSVAISQGAVIDNANLIFTSNGDASVTTVNTKIRGENIADASTFSTISNYDSRDRTTASVNWNSIGTWATDIEYVSPNIKSVIQEIVDRLLWSSGNDIVLFWDDHDENSTLGASRVAYSYNGSTTKCPVLYIEYHTITSPSRDSAKTISFSTSKKTLEFA